MKKIITSLLVLLTLSTLSAKTADVEINITVPEIPVVYELFYNGINIDQTTDYEIAAPSLEQGHTTELFEIIASGNLQNSLPVTVTVTPAEFKSILDGAQHNSGITPAENTLTQSNTFPAGKHTNLVLYSFTLSWVGDTEVAAGEYTSDVNIGYTVE